MSVRIYLKEEIVGEKEFTIGDNGRAGSYLGLPIFHDFKKGRWYIDITFIDEQTPLVLRNFVESVSVCEILPSFPKREEGIYRHESATAEVLSILPERTELRVRVISNNMEDACNLMREIRVGSIRPLPDGSYEGKQTGTSHADSVARISELETELKRLQSLNTEMQGTLVFLHRRLINYKIDVFRTAWPFCFKSGVEKFVDSLLGKIATKLPG